MIVLLRNQQKTFLLLLLFLFFTSSIRAQDCSSVLSIRQVENTYDNCGSWCNGAYVFTLGAGNCYTAGDDLTFTEYTDGTAILEGSVVQNGNTGQLLVTFTERTEVAPDGSPKYMLCVSEGGESWYYYPSFSGVFTYPDGSTTTISKFGPSFQVGYGANLQDTQFGASGWFTDGSGHSGDMNFQLSSPIECAEEGIYLESECAAVGSLFETFSDSQASNGDYITVKPGNNSLSNAPDNSADRVRFSIDVSKTGSYNIFARVKAPSGSDDSFWVRANNGTWIKWNNIQSNSSFIWDQVHDNNNGNTPVSFYLETGSNTIDFAYREDGTLLDKIYVTLDGDAPTGIGEEAQNCECQDVININCVAVNNICGENENIGVNLEITGSSQNYSILWSNGATTQNISNVEPGTYSVTVTDETGCFAICETTLVDNEPFSILCESTNVTCGSGTGGTATVTVTGGSAPYIYHWSNNACTAYEEGLETGVYTITVTDNNGCEEICSFEIIYDEPTITATGNSVGNSICGVDYCSLYCFESSTGNDDVSAQMSISYNETGDQITIRTVYAKSYCDNTYGQNVIGWPGNNHKFDHLRGSDNLELVLFNGAGDESLGFAMDYLHNFDGVYRTGGISAGDGSMINGDPAYILDVKTSISENFNTYGYVLTTDSPATDENYTPNPNYPNWIYEMWYEVTIDADAFGSSGFGYPEITNFHCSPSKTGFSAEPLTLIGCCGSNCNGSIDVTVTEGDAPFTYLWSNGATTEDINDLCEGIYTVTVQDANGCSLTFTYEVDQASPIELSCSVTDPSCDPSIGGAITAVVNGNAEDYTFLWSNGATSQNIDNLEPGTYSVTVSDANDCSVTCEATIEQLDPLAVACQATNTSCDDNNDGAVSVSVSGGQAPFSYSWNNGNTSNAQQNIGAGIYSVIVIDANGCEATCSVEIVSNDPISITCVVQDNPCEGNINSVITTSVSGGNGNYSYIWSNGNTAVNLDNIGPGNYSVTVTDQNGCSAVCEAVIEQLNPFAVACQATNTSCGNNDGAVSVSVSGGQAPFSYSWNNGNTSNAQQNIGAGIYSVIVTDANGCEATCSVEIVSNDPINITCLVQDNPCEGNINSVITTSISGGNGNYSYVWSNGNTAANLDNIGPGNYSVTVTDQNGCSAVCEAAIEQLSPFAVSCQATNTSCDNNDGAVSVSVSGGQAPFSYSWNNGNTSNAQQNIGAGTYSVIVTDANGCEAACSVEVFNSDPITLICSAQNGDCNQPTGSISTIVNGGTGVYTFLWSNGATTQNISNIESGIYSVTVTDENECQAVCEASLINLNTISASCEANDLICGESNTGMVTLSVSGGNLPYTYQWNNGATTQNLDNLNAGNYQVTITDANGCLAICETVVETPVPIFVISSSTPLACHGDSTSTADFIIEGGVPPYTYLWDNGSTESVIENLSAGFYGITVTDANGCIGICGTSVETPEAIEATFENTMASCFGGNDGSILATVTGGTGDYTYEWSNGTTTNTLNGLVTGDYTLTISDENGCTNVFTTTIESTAEIIASCTSTPLSCHQNNSGSIQLIVTGGTGNYTFEWSNGATTQNLETLNSGNYSVIVTDENGCTSTCSTVVDAPTPLTISCNANDLICAEAATGAINVIVEGGTAPYTYQWSTGGITQNLSDLDTGIYEVTVTDANDCSATCSATVATSAALTATCTGQDLLCGESNNGAIQVTVNGGTAPFIYNWNNGATTQNLDNLSAGVYEVTITDANGCNSICNTTIVAIESLSATCFGQDLLCGDANSGNVDLSITGGTAPYTYLWSNGATTQNLVDVNEGNYTVTITDANGCVASCESSISYIAPISATCTGQDLECAMAQTGGVNLTVSGGTLPYSFLWNNGQITEDLNNINAGDYTVMITDANGCTAICSSTVSSTPALEVSCDAGGVTCGNSNSGNIDIEVNGGEAPFSFLWSNGMTTEDLSGIPSGFYEVMVTDANGCIASCATTVEVSIGLDLACIPVGTQCGEENTGSIDLTVQGGTGNYTFNWSNGETTEDLSALNPGTYSVTVSDSNGCTGVCNSSVEESMEMEATCTSEEIPCGGQPDGSIDVTVTGGSGDYTYEWSNGATTQDITGVTAGTYEVTVTDSNGCTTTCSNTVTEGAALQVTCVKTNISCKNANDGSIDVSVSGGAEPYVFTWSNGASTEDLQNLSNATYTITVTDANGCSNTCTSTITEPATLLVIASGNNISCNGANDGTAFATVIGGSVPYSYSWSNGAVSPFINALTPGSYTLTVTDAHGCQNFAAVVISEPELMTASCFAVNENCQPASGAIDLNITGGTAPYTYNWSNGAASEDLFNIVAGNYSVTVTDAKGCFAVCSSIVESGNPINLSSIATNASCGIPSVGSIDLTVTGGTGPYFYQWSNGVSTEDNPDIEAGSYTVTVTDIFGCSSIHTSTIEEAQSLSLQLTNQNITCYGAANGSIILNVSQGVAPFTYQWSNGANSENIGNLTAGTYSVTVTDAGGCQGFATATITQPSSLLVVSSSTPLDCNGDTDGTAFITAIGGTAPYQYLWSNNATSPFINALSAGTYLVTVTDALGCSVVSSTIIEEPAPIDISFTNNQLICPEDNNGSITTTIIGGQAPYSYQWSNGANSENIDLLTAGVYTVTVTDNNGCSNTGSTTIEAINPLTVLCHAQDVLCAGESNGEVNVEVGGGLAPYTFEWSTGSTEMFILDVHAGQYEVTVTDANGCSAICSSQVNEPAQLIAIYGSTDVTCNGGQDGTLYANTQGGVGPYTYEWSTGDSTETVEDLPAGAYGLTLTDANGCIFICGIIINEPEAITCSSEVVPTSPDNPDLYDIIITANGGTGSYQYSIDDGLTYQSSEVFSNLTADTYTVLISDENGCISDCGPIEVGPLGLGDQENTRTAISPNPAQDDLAVSYETETEAFTIFEVKNIDGKVLYQKEMVTQAGKNTLSINTTKYASGTYVLAIYTDKGVKTKQFMVLKRKQ